MKKIGKKGRNRRASCRRKRSFKGNQFTNNKDVDSSLEGAPDWTVEGEEASTNISDQHEEVQI